jgi:hypothetical protein
MKLIKVRKFSPLVIAKITKYHKAFYKFVGTTPKETKW